MSETDLRVCLKNHFCKICLCSFSSPARKLPWADADLKMSFTTGEIPGHFSLGGHMLTPLLHSLFYGFSRILEYALTGKCRSFMGITIIANFRLVKRISKFHIPDCDSSYCSLFHSNTLFDAAKAFFPESRTLAIPHSSVIPPYQWFLI